MGVKEIVTKTAPAGGIGGLPGAASQVAVPPLIWRSATKSKAYLPETWRS